MSKLVNILGHSLYKLVAKESYFFSWVTYDILLLVMATPITPTSKQECEATLNISIPENIWIENPKFAGLLVEIATKKLRKLSLHSNTWAKFEKQTEENNKIRIVYLQHKILFDTLNSVLSDISTDDTSLSVLATHALDMISIHSASHMDQPFIAKSYFETFLKDMDKPEGLKTLRGSVGELLDFRSLIRKIIYNVF